MGDNAVILADSVNAVTGDRITTFLLPRFPKCLLAEINTHRMFSRNSASSRAMPISKVIEGIRSDPYVPSFTRKNKGMQGIDNLAPHEKLVSEMIWLDAMEEMISIAEALANEVGVAKQEANRLLEPFMRVPVLVTATEWDNFFRLRCHPAAQPDFQIVARDMRQELQQSSVKALEPGEWHIPFGENLEGVSRDVLLKVATARCARISYKTHDGEFSIERDIALHDRLLEDNHLSPFEHTAKAGEESVFTSNFKGWVSYRATLGRL